jgi:very-short-patch-repair endonuclease
VPNGARPSPSPDKGRPGEGLGFIPYDKHLTALARENRKNPTPTERKLWNEVLRHRQFAHYKFLRQKPLLHYIVDFYCSELRLAIEIDGDTHAGQIDYDKVRKKLLTRHNLTVIRYSNNDVLTNIEGIFADLMTQITAIISP